MQKFRGVIFAYVALFYSGLTFEKELSENHLKMAPFGH